jgi:hypothetical protein
LRDALGRPLPPGSAGFPPYDDDPPLAAGDALTYAEELLRAGRPFTAHEVLEGVWKRTGGPERQLWRGLAQLAVALTHRARGNPTGAAALFERAARNLDAYAALGARPAEVPLADVARLAAWARAASVGEASTPRPSLLADARPASGDGASGAGTGAGGGSGG